MKRSLLLLVVLCGIWSVSGAQIIINKYAAVLQRPACSNSFVVDTATGFGVGDTVLLIQMKGATIDSSNTSSFGTVINYNGAGNYEFNVISSVSGNTISLLYKIKRTYDVPAGRVQLVRVPYYRNYTVNLLHTCMPWNGAKGGIVVINAADTLTLNAPVDVSSKGFRSGKLIDFTAAPCAAAGYYYSNGLSSSGAEKGEGITTLSIGKSHGRGAQANGGGGGNSHNTGGAGGGNAGAGGTGGLETAIPACAPSQAMGGRSGIALTYSNTANRIFLGGGAGAGHANNGDGGVGGAGGGIIMLLANQLAGNGNALTANGGAGSGCTGDCWDGQPGGGAGGTILLHVNTYLSGLALTATGGAGASLANNNSVDGPCGPGGGGGGGVAWVKSPSVPGLISTTLSGGASGIYLNNMDPYGSTAGTAGTTLTGLTIVSPSDTFQNGTIGPVVIKDSVVDCFTRIMIVRSPAYMTGMVYKWEFPGGTTATTPNASFTFPGYGAHTVKLTIDFNGCPNVATGVVNIPYVHFAKGVDDTATCYGKPVYLNALGGMSYAWSPAAGLVNPNMAYTKAEPLQTTSYVVTVTDSKGCVDRDTVVVTVVPSPNPVSARPDDTVSCVGKTLQLQASGSSSYQWVPVAGLNNANIANPVATVKSSIKYTVLGRDAAGCVSADTVSIALKPGPEVSAVSGGVANGCEGTAIELKASGNAIRYEWSPSSYIQSSGNGSVVKATPPQTTVFTVTGYDADGCAGTDTVTAFSTSAVRVFMPDAFTPNGDGRNDAIRPLVYCDFTMDEYRIYNRWGQLVYSTGEITQPWGGNYGGLPADVGQYHYVIIGRRPSNNERVMYKGNFALIR